MRASISRHGFDPDLYGDIEGYVMRDPTGVCFFVRGGKHRAAALTALGHTSITVGFRNSFPRLIDSAQAEQWPLVRQRKIDVSLAKQILACYISGR